MGSDELSERTQAVWLVRGARSCEETVLREVARRVELRPAGELQRPIRVVVPSRSLRQHIQARLASRASWIGVQVQTLWQLAAEVCERAEQEVPRRSALIEVLALRAAARCPALAAPLEGLAEHSQPLAGTVRDLLDAGFEASHHEAVSERLAELPNLAAVTRAEALVDVAASVSLQAEALNVGGSGALWRRATMLLANGGERALPSFGVVIHGFGNATGLASDLLETLVTQLGAHVVVDIPEDPARPGEDDAGIPFTQRLRGRLAGWRGERVLAPPRSASPRLTWLQAEGTENEVEAVASAILALFERVTAAERIGVVARQLAPYESCIATAFERLGIPFSMQGGRGLGGPARRLLAAFGELIERGPRARVDTWLTLLGEIPDHVDLAVGVRVAGITSVQELAELDVETLLGGASGLALPVGSGIECVEDEGMTRLLARRRHLSRRTLEWAIAEARRACELLSGSRVGTLDSHAATLRKLAEVSLSQHLVAREKVEAALAELAALAPGSFELEWNEVKLLFRRTLAGAGWESLGGRGAGVQVMGVTQARGLTFDHLFLLGLGRDVFPRVVSQDPLLPDWLRLALLPLLPELPVKEQGHDEERYLFAHLLGTAPEVTLCWQVADDDGRELSPSPLVQRLLLTRVPSEETADALPIPPLPRTPMEAASRAGLRGNREAWQALVALSLEDTKVACEGQAAALAEIRRRVLEEVDPDRSTPQGRALASAGGPYLGFVGRAASHPELEGLLYVTTLEALARCGWQTFLRRILRLEQPPDPASNLASLSAGLQGDVVHRVLAAIAGGAQTVRSSWHEAISRQPHARHWPAPAEVEALTLRIAAEAAREAGIHARGLAVALARRALVFLETASECDWKPQPPPVVGVEVEGRVPVTDGEGRTRWLRFACDRLDRGSGAGVVGSDYKTGRPLLDVKTTEARRNHLLAAIRKGAALQAAVYALAAGQEGVGRYLYLAPDIEPTERELVIHHDDLQAGAALAEIATVLLGIWDEGALLPRLTDPGGRESGEACRFCELAEACLQHDTTARQRIAAWTGSEGCEELVSAWWLLPSIKPSARSAR